MCHKIFYEKSPLWQSFVTSQSFSTTGHASSTTPWFWGFWDSLAPHWATENTNHPWLQIALPISQCSQNAVTWLNLWPVSEDSWGKFLQESSQDRISWKKMGWFLPSTPVKSRLEDIRARIFTKHLELPFKVLHQQTYIRQASTVQYLKFDWRFFWLGCFFCYIFEWSERPRLVPKHPSWACQNLESR